MAMPMTYAHAYVAAMLASPGVYDYVYAYASTMLANADVYHDIMMARESMFEVDAGIMPMPMPAQYLPAVAFMLMPMSAPCLRAVAFMAMP